MKRQEKSSLDILIERCASPEDAFVHAGQASLFTMSADNAMVQFISRGAPRILESQVESS